MIINSQDLDIVTSGNSLRQNQNRMNKLFDDEDHKNLKKFHLKNQMDNDILVKDEQDDMFDITNIMSDQQRLQRLGYNQNALQVLKNQNNTNTGIDEFTANWKNPSEVKQDAQKSITILNLQSMDETSKNMLQQKDNNNFQKLLMQMQSPISFDNKQSLMNAMNGINSNNGRIHTEQSQKQAQKTTFQYNVYQTANRLRQKLISKLERVKLLNLTNFHLRLIDDWSSLMNNRQFSCQNLECQINQDLGNIKKSSCCFQSTSKNISNVNNKDQNSLFIKETSKQLEQISIGSNSNFTSKKKMINLFQSARSFKDQPLQSTETSQKPKTERKSIIQIYSSILLWVTCIKTAINPTDLKRLIIDLLQVLFLIIFYFFITLRAVFENEIDRLLISNDTDINQNTIIFYFACVGFPLQLIDLFMSYITGFYNKGILITDANIASLRYFKRFFIFDLVSILCLLFFIIGSQDPPIVIKVLYFLKIQSSFQSLKRLKLKASINQFRKLVFKILYNGAIFGLVLHSFTVIWIAIGKNESRSNTQKAMINTSWIDYNQLTNQNWHYLYTASLQFMCSSLIFQGMQTKTQSEQLFLVFTQIFSVFFIYRFVCSFIKMAKLYSFSASYSDKAVFISNFLPKRNVPEQIIVDAKQNLKYTLTKKYKQNREHQSKNQLKLLNSSLKDKIIESINKKIIDKMEIMKIFTEKFKTQISKHLDEIQFEKGQIVYYQGEETDCNLYFVAQGQVELFYVTEKRCKDEENYLVFQTIQTGQHFGQLSFFTGMPRESYARCSEESIVFKVNRDQFRNIIQENQKDLEIFCEIKDDLLFQNEHNLVFQVCSACKKEKHQVIDCPEVHFVADKEKIILSQNCPKVQLRSPGFAKRKKKDFNALSDQNGINQAAQKVEQNSSLYNKCMFDAMNTSCGFYDQRLNQSNLELDQFNDNLSKESDDGFNNENNQNTKHQQSLEGLPSKNNLVYTDIDQEQSNRRKSEHHLQNLNTLNTTNKQRSFTKEDEFFFEQKSGQSFLYPIRKDTSHAITNVINNGASSQGNILIPTQQELAVSPIPSLNQEQSFFSNQIKSKPYLSKNNSNNIQQDESINNSSQFLNFQHNQNSEFPQRNLTPEDVFDQKVNHAKEMIHSASPNVHRNKKKNLTWNIVDEVQQMQTICNTPQNQTAKTSNQSNINVNNQNVHSSFANSNQNALNHISNNCNINNTVTTPLSYSSSNIINTVNQIPNQNINNSINNINNNNEQNYQGSPSMTHQTRRISQTPKTLYQIHKEELGILQGYDEVIGKHVQRQKSIIQHQLDNNINQTPKQTDSNYSEQVQYNQSPHIDIQNGYSSTKVLGSQPYINNNHGIAINYNSGTNINNIILNSNSLGNNYNDAITEQSKVQKQTSTRKRTSSKFNDSQYKADSDSQNSASQFKKVANNKKKKILTIIQEQSPLVRSGNQMKKPSLINPLQASQVMMPFSIQFDESNSSQLIPMATSMQFTNNYLDSKKQSIVKGKSQFNNSQLLSSIDFLSTQQQQHLQQLSQINQQLGILGEFFPDKVEQSMLYSVYNDKSKHSIKSKINLPKLSQVIPQLQTNLQSYNNPNQQFQNQQSISKFFQNMNGRLRKSIALKKIQNYQEQLQDQLNYSQYGDSFYQNFGMDRNLRNNEIDIGYFNKNYNAQYVPYIPKLDENLESIKEFQFYKPHYNIKVILKQLESSLKNKKLKTKSFRQQGNSFYVYSLKIKNKNQK
ncbi:cyclic nucleotide-binding domain protein (macronuclear) [Tetrahymena thermophila SB210]|uniref:Cyclic nucleotide-binding domain protein n=1 Tax=Tetrahymena thermophila (strain SB210) TaxID=312017 RepID=W7X284_TETTS|nr:cyclic nucleotide-binding domain protein [Tetrahymena thermophila SB210]EWS71747.1 cyclic nucleotide-binding domain protein [Tetrahymena thermophila SB210]|eukprot:XP_012655700.1 cyclic nucleotide-binding domain protein [Tetrahymena thermophila SB210]